MVTKKRGAWGRANREEIGGARAEWERTGEGYTGAVPEWRNPCAFSVLWLEAPVTLLSRSGTIERVGEN